MSGTGTATLATTPVGVRTDMATLITTLRGFTDCGTADYTIAGTAYWQDIHLQEALDRHRNDFYRQQMTSVLTYTGGGSVEYLRYYAGLENLESGTTCFILENSTGDVVGTANYTANYAQGVVDFATDQAGTVYYLTGRSYDINAAAYDVWRTKAANVAKSFSFTTDNHRIDRGALRKEYLAMADYYKSLSGEAVSVARVGRGDIANMWSEHDHR
jgi:hypothetical protein